MESLLLGSKSVARAYAELQREIGDTRSVAYRFKLELLKVRIIHVPTGRFKVVPLF